MFLNSGILLLALLKLCAKTKVTFCYFVHRNDAPGGSFKTGEVNESMYLYQSYFSRIYMLDTENKYARGNII